MLTHIHPKIPMRNKEITRNFYINSLDFEEIGAVDFNEYLMIKKDQIELHFFLFESINPLENYGQVYIRTYGIESLYEDFLRKQIDIHPNGKLQEKPWGQKEFSILDPDGNLLTFGQSSD
ncbi:glyoxalase/bleomycin resistance/extradiol dioxygenase family protein [Kaistella haifensis DSM 19056]|uniref:Bleomycin resistance protein n=1 Tax=Kaistella haifensis DSM 19056 TaxID=1450526 RepID=A0A246BCN9_9FLAO|nr:VOC family protein [Kaistella haifensis]OWK99443.1 glyoxalase/bleomycin resistance/extradiol dioxygenase family protein [Kaistella haifensis DSM 19056]